MQTKRRRRSNARGFATPEAAQAWAKEAGDASVYRIAGRDAGGAVKALELVKPQMELQQMPVSGVHGDNMGDMLRWKPGEAIPKGKAAAVDETRGFVDGLDEGMGGLKGVKEDGPEGIDFAAEEPIHKSKDKNAIFEDSQVVTKRNLSRLIKGNEDGSFRVIDWNGYPYNGPKPNCDLRLIDNDKYVIARSEANAANSKIHRNDPLAKGKEIHEIHPVRFGGNPIDKSNKIYLTSEEHDLYTRWWNHLQKLLEERQK